MKVIAGALLVTAVAVMILSLVPLTYGVFFACVAAVAFCFGGNITVFPAIVADYFGLKNQSKTMASSIRDLELEPWLDPLSVPCWADSI